MHRVNASMRVVVSIALGFAAVFASGDRITAAGPLDAAPDDMEFVVRYASLDRYLGNAGDLLAAIGPAAAKAGSYLEDELLTDLQLASGGVGVFDRKSPVFIVGYLSRVTDRPGPTTAILAKVSDAEKLHRALFAVDEFKQVERVPGENGFTELRSGRRRAYLAKRGDYTIYTTSPIVYRDLKDFDAAKSKPLSAMLEAKATQALATGDAAIWLNVPRLARLFKPRVEAHRKQVIEAINGLTDEDLGVPNSATAKRLYTQIAASLFDGVYEATWAVGSVSLAAHGGGATMAVGFRQDSPMSRRFATTPPAPLANVELLPSGASLYLGLLTNYDGWSDLWLKSAYGDAPANREAAVKSLEVMRAAGVRSTATSLSLGGKNGVVSTTLEEASDAAKLRQGWAAFIRAVEAVKAPVIAQNLTYKSNAEKHKEYAIDLMKIGLDLKIDDPEIAALVKPLFQRLFGKGLSLESRIASTENLLVQTTANDPGVIRKLLDSFESGEGVLGLEKAYAATRDRLAEDAHFLLLIDAPRLSIEVANLVKVLEPFDAFFGLAPFNFRIDPPASYSGLSITAEPDVLTIKTYVPSDQVKSMLQILLPGV